MEIPRSAEAGASRKPLLTMAALFPSPSPCRRRSLPGLVLWGDLRQDAPDARFLGDDLGGAAVAPGEQNGFETHPVKSLDGLAGALLQGVRRRQQGGRNPVDGEEHRGLSLLGLDFDGVAQAGDVHPFGLHQFGVSQNDGSPFHGGADAAARNGGETFRGRKGHAALPGLVQDRDPQGMPGWPLRGSRETQDLFGRESVGGDSGPSLRVCPRSGRPSFQK